MPLLSQPKEANSSETHAALDYVLAVIAFESVQARMKLAIDIGDLDLIEKTSPELAEACAAVRAAKAPERVLN